MKNENTVYNIANKTWNFDKNTGNTSFRILDSSNEYVADICNYHRKEALENAYLISAAPEMLQVLEEILSDKNCSLILRERIRNIICKANGYKMKTIVEIEGENFDVLFHVNHYGEIEIDEIRLEDCEIDLYDLLKEDIIDGICDKLKNLQE